MCDYSLQGIRNRLAEQGEILVVHRFQTGSKGLTSPGILRPVEKPKKWLAALKRLLAVPAEECAVCIPDGAQLRLSAIPAWLQRRHGVSADEPVTFRQLSADAATYRDAVEFRNGSKVRLQDLEPGQPVEVVALSSEDVNAPEEVLFPEMPNSRAWIHRNQW